MLNYRTDESNELIPSEADRRSPTKAGVVKAKEAVTALGNSVGMTLGAGGVGYVSPNVGSAELNHSS
jgi:hypothetical protein